MCLLQMIKMEIASNGNAREGSSGRGKMIPEESMEMWEGIPSRGKGKQENKSKEMAMD